MRSTKQVKYVDVTTQPLVFIGFMGSGKSTLARQIARALRLGFADLDQCIVQNAGRSIPELFRLEGEAGFRSRESKALKAALKPGQVLALGGGTLSRPENRDLLIRARAHVVWIDPSWQELWARLSKLDPRKRPLLWDEELGQPKKEATVRRLWNQRRGTYRRSARLVVRVRVGEAAETTAKRVLGGLRPA